MSFDCPVCGDVRHVDDTELVCWLCRWPVHAPSPPTPGERRVLLLVAASRHPDGLDALGTKAREWLVS